MFVRSLALFIKKGYKCRDLKLLRILTVCLYFCLSCPTCKENAPITLSLVACPALPLFSTLSYKRQYFMRHLANIKCVFRFSLQLLCVTFLILKEIS